MPEGGGMAVTSSLNPYLSPVHSSGSLRRYSLSEEEEGDDNNNWSSRNSTRSLDSLDTLFLTLPDVIIPELLYNPLPLQCLAASALPECLRKEIDVVLKKYTSSVVTSPMHNMQACVTGSSDTGVELRRRRYGHSGSVVCKDRDGVIVSIGENSSESIHPVSENASSGDRDRDVTLHHIKVTREVTPLPENINDLGLDFLVTGGVKCSSCKILHTVITSVSADAANPILAEGSSIKEWNGKDLEDCTFEEVKIFLNEFVNSDCNQVELTVKECSGDLISRPRQFRTDRSGIYGSWHRQKTHAVVDHMQSNGLIKTEETDSLHMPRDHRFSRKSRPQSLELLSETSPPPPNHTQNSSHSRSPTPEDLQNETVEVSIPRLDSNARALSAAMEGRSPHKIDEGVFSRFSTNGMIQLSLKYDSEKEDLKVTLNKVICQSSKDTQHADVFINTYLIPDTKNQGVRSIHAVGDDHSSTGNGRSSATEDSHSYTISETELDKCALRILLWDATKGKKIVLKGEVLLSLLDMNTVTLNGHPMWFTICPLDPNIATLPEPVHYKQQRNLKLLAKFRRSLANINTVKSSAPQSSGGSILDIGQGDSLRGTSILNRGGNRRFTKLKSRTNNRKIMDILESEMGTSNHTINEAKLVKLHSILNVLRCEDEASDSDVPEQTVTPEFVNIFDNAKNADQQRDHHTNDKDGQKNTTVTPESVNIFNNTKNADQQRDHHTHDKKDQQKNNLLKYALRNLHEDSPEASSDSGDNLENSPTRHSMNEQSLAWLVKKKRGKSRSKDKGKHQRPRSDSFQTIPRLRESLHGGRINKVNKYTFDDEENLADKHKSTSDIQGQDNATDLKLHYKVNTKLVDGSPSSREKPNLEETDSNIASPDCKCYPVPVEISVHRISIVDVDKAKDEEDRIRAHSFDNRNNKHKKPSSGMLQHLKEEGVQQSKARSMSLGDMKRLESEKDEVLIVRAPFNTANQQGRKNEHTATVDSPTTSQWPVSDADQSLSSLDFKSNHQHHYHPMRSQESSSSVDFKADENLDESLSDSWELVREVGNQQRRTSQRISQDDMMGSWESVTSNFAEVTKYRSMDNLLDSSESGKSKSKKEWKNTYLHSSSHNNTEIHSGLVNGVKTVGDAKLEIEYNRLNPKQPVLLVKLLDILFLSSKSLPSEFLMKCQLVHNNTGVCILKNKTLVNIKTPTPSAPLGLSHFQTDIVNLSLEISFFSSGLFSKKEIGHISINLNSLELTATATYSEWLPIIKDIVT